MEESASDDLTVAVERALDAREAQGLGRHVTDPSILRAIEEAVR